VQVSRIQLESLYERLFSIYGPQHWWPAKTRFEIMVGAILTQNTAWTNVERAILNLRQADCLDPASILELPENDLAGHLRPSGYFNIKARRLNNFCRWYHDEGEYRKLKHSDTQLLRKKLLGINGVGPETADDILLYAFERPVFVVDAYTRRLLSRLGWARGDESYEMLRSVFETGLTPDVPMFNEYHALIVRHAKEKCTGHNRCRHCYVEKL